MPTDTSTDQRKRHSGFAIVTVLFLLPVLISVFVAIAAAILLLKQDVQDMNICLSTLYGHQGKMATTLDRLLKLNPRALRLRKLRQDAERKLQNAKATANPYAVAAATAYLAWVIARQTLLDQEQKSLLSLARRNASVAQGRLMSADDFTRSHAPELQVDPDIHNTLAPLYWKRNYFFEQQKAMGFYRINVLEILPQLLRHWLQYKHADTAAYIEPTLARSCAVSIEFRFGLHRARGTL